MGWTSYHATHYKNNGTIDRKAECDGYFMDGLNAGYYNVKKSALVGSVYYAAVEVLKRYKREAGQIVKDTAGNPIIEDIPQEGRHIFASVMLTSTDRRDYYNFSYKDMDESMGPAEIACPLSILNLLSATDSEWANEWRKRCREYAEEKKNPHALNNLPIGATIQFVRYDGESVQLIKHQAAYQFKRPFWYCPATGCYMPVKRIPNAYEVVKTA